MVAADTGGAGVMRHLVMCHQCDGAPAAVIFERCSLAHIVVLGGCVTRQNCLEWFVTIGFQRCAWDTVVETGKKSQNDQGVWALLSQAHCVAGRL